jgi:hypothetical protein
MDVRDGVVSSIFEADIDDGVYLGEFSDEIGLEDVNTVIGGMKEMSVDFGGGVVDVSVSNVLESFEGRHIQMSRKFKFSQKKAKQILALCERESGSIIAYG